MRVVLDVETTGLNYWEPDFRVISVAAAWKPKEIATEYADTPEGIERILRWAANHDVVVYNASYEHGVFSCCYPHIPLKIETDVMRLVQLFDAGGAGNQLSLKESAKRILGEASGNWEKPIHEWIAANISDPTARKKPGAYLHKAPPQLLREYNQKDVERTHQLMEYILVRFEVAGYDWSQDMSMFLYMVRQFVAAKTHGIPVDREALASYVEELTGKMQSIDASFLQFFEDAVKDVQGLLHAKVQSLYKRKIVTEIPKMNPGSTHHLGMLFCEVLKLTPRITTPKGRPCFKTKYLAQWGEGGQLLAGRSKAQFTRAQSLALLERSANSDARWHPDLSPGTTVTGRNKTYGGLNILALDRRDKGFMQTLLADPSQTLVSIDLAAGEPTVVANFSRDKYYRYATVDGVGKSPYFDARGVLMIDDIYMMLMSQTPMGREVLKADFSAQWAEDWVRDADAMKTRYKNLRNLHKIAALGMSYGMGPAKLQKTFFEAGYDYELDICTTVYSAYWNLFADVKRYADRLAAFVQKKKHLDNPFGFRCYPASPRLAFNYITQSTVNGLMAVLTMCIENENAGARLLTCIHDELIYSIPTGAEETFRTQVKSATQRLNDTLQWDVPIRTGFVTGRNFYEAK